MLDRKALFPSTLSALTIALATAALMSSCSRAYHETQISGPHVVGPSVHGTPQNVQDYQPNETKEVSLDNGARTPVERIGNKLLFHVEGILTRQSFDAIQREAAQKPASERSAFIQSKMSELFNKASRIGAIPAYADPSIGYFQMLVPYRTDLLADVKSLQFDSRENADIAFAVQPMVFDKNELTNIKALSEMMNEEAPLDPRASNSNFSGLERIGAPKFVREAEKDIGGGVKVDGSTVQVGVTDTGITYNHPTFLSALTGKNRIDYLADSTGEGTIYINSAAKLSAAAGATDQDITLNAQMIVTPKLPTLPAADDLKEVKDLKIKVSPELRALLLAPNASGAKLGMIDENVLSSAEDPVDMNANGTTNDKLYVLYFPARNGMPERVYFDSSGTKDFRKSVAITDFNASHQTVPVFAEKIGFSFSNEKLSNAKGDKSINVRGISFVGYDAGNHGSHVSGIIAGRKTIANDSDDTLARGVAPEARIALNRVCSNNAGCSELKGIADLAKNANVNVINMSLGGLSPFNDGHGVAETLINRLVSTKNIMFMISAGNDGPGRQTIGSPSTARLALSIGATASRSMIQRQFEWPGLGSSLPQADNEDFMLFFSSRGPTASGGFKPNITAPGAELSSVHLNAAPGTRGGLDVYWGTSMAAPTATGGYALLLDAIHKYNARHPQSKLTTDAMTLRRVLLETARPFDVNSLDLSTGKRSRGQYTWADEGTGMINLPAAWKELFAVRDSTPPTAVNLNGKPVELDYQVLASAAKEPNGNADDGSRTENKEPVFATGVYLSASDPATMKTVHIERKLPEALMTGDSAGELTAQLETTADEFVLRTVLYGSDQPWLKAGTLQQTDCSGSVSDNLELVGNGGVIGTDNGKPSINSMVASTLNICINKAVEEKLAPGDHGALIYAYRKVGSQVAPVASFIVPVYLNVPDKTLKDSSSLAYDGTINSFGVDRHYVMVPPGTSVLRIVLEVPPVKLDPTGAVARGETCSGVELMAYEGQNTAKVFKDRLKARVANCSISGEPLNDLASRKLVVTRTNPRPGLWDVHVYGQYTFIQSKYQLKVDYVTGVPSVKMIQGGLAALNGSLDWTLKEASLKALPDSKASRIELDSLEARTSSQVQTGDSVYVMNPLGVLRTYPSDVQSVTETTGESTGNDIDLVVLECPKDATSADDERCQQAASSGGPTDEEQASFTPKPGMKYAVRVDGFDVKNNDGKFVATETLKLKSERGTVQVSGGAPNFSLAYSFDVNSSALLKQPLFAQGKYMATGSLSIRMADDTVLSAIPVTIENK